MIAITCFVATVLLTLLITAWAGRRGRERDSLYAAGGSLSGMQNGFAISGDFMSATTVLGITGLFLKQGWDTTIFYLAPLAGLAIMIALVAGPLRELGRYTLGDVITHRLKDQRLRLFSGVNTITISLFYLVAQMVGAGSLTSLLFGLPFAVAVAIVGSLMAIYVAVGGMLAATWVQIVKAVLLASAVTTLAVLALIAGGGLEGLHARAAAVHGGLSLPGAAHLDLFSAISLGFGMVVGLVGMPHLLIRFFTVRDAHQAGRSVAVASTVIAAINAILFLVIGPAAVAFVAGEPRFHVAGGALRGGVNMASVHLSTALGGETATGIFSAVAFSTILAVVAGLTIAAASAASHDVYRVIRGDRPPNEREEVRAFRMAAVLVAVVAVLLALVFQHENIAFLSALAFAIAASTNFPLLMLVLYWRRLTAAGALAGGVTGLGVSVGLIVVGPAIWVTVLGHQSPLFPSEFPALVTAPLSAVVAVAVSLLRADR
jgi:cation/acetate symporter